VLSLALCNSSMFASLSRVISTFILGREGERDKGERIREREREREIRERERERR